MKITLLTYVKINKVTYAKGKVVEFDDDEAERLIKDGAAKKPSSEDIAASKKIEAAEKVEKDAKDKAKADLKKRQEEERYGR